MMGSDAHRMNHRRPKLTKGADYIREHCRPEYAEDVLWRNAEKLLLVEAGHDLNKVSEGNPLELCSGQQGDK